MFVETLEGLPESMQSQFVETEIDGKKGFQDKDSFELRKHLFNVKDENAKLKTSKAEISTKLNEFETKQQEVIEKARADALEEARTKGDVKAIEERYQQQMADLEKRSKEAGRTEAMKEFKEQQATAKALSIAEKIGLSIGLDGDAGEMITMAIKGRVQIDPETGKEIYYDANGGALSVDQKGFIDELKKETRMKYLVKADVPTNGGGLANGSGRGGASVKEIDRDSFSRLKPTEQMNFVKSGGKIK